ncbi:MAG: hypothetical protein QM754_00850 [Tepidisphaeraceae bacterium]
MTDTPASRAFPRTTALAAGFGFFVLILLFAFGAFSGNSVAGLGATNGPAVLISWLIDTAIDLAFVTLWLVAGYGYGWRAVCMLPIPQENREPCGEPMLFNTSATAFGLGVMGLLTLGLGWAGLLGHKSAIAVLAVGIALLPWWRFRAVGPWTKEPAGKRFWIGVGTVALLAGIMIPLASLPPMLLWRPLDPHPFDVMSYHLQVPREWYELGRIAPLGHNAFSYFPMGQEMHALLAMHVYKSPWAAMFVTQYQSVAFTLMTVLAVVGIMRQLGAAAWAWPAGQLVAFVPWTMMLGTVGYVESGVTLYSTLTVGWLMTVRRGRSLVLAGIFAGLAGGMKYTALAMTAAPAFALWPVFAGRNFKRWVVPWLVGIAVCLVTVSPWMIRNIIWTGNPIFPVGTSVFGRGPFTPELAERFQVAHQPPPAEQPVARRLEAAWSRVATDPQYAYGLLPLAVVGIVFGWRTPTGRYAAVVLIAAGGVWLFGTHDMPRFLAPAIPLAVLLIRFWPAKKWANIVLAAGVVITSLVGLQFTIHAAAENIARGRQVGLFRMGDLTQLLPEDVKKIQDTGGKLALVGETQAFFYPFEPGKLLYRNVFNVDMQPDDKLADGWLGKSVTQLRREGWWVLVNPAELVRLSSTYRHLPAASTPFDDPTAGPILLPPTVP